MTLPALFGAVPPEVSSTQLYSGPGSGPYIAAASAWDAIAGQLRISAQEYAATMSELTDLHWSGAAAARMAAAGNRYLDWLTSTEVNAEHTAAQLRSAARAYESAKATITPPDAVFQNRLLQRQLIAANVLGQNTALIGQLEAQYLQMWITNVAVMTGYAQASQQAVAIRKFDQAPQTTSNTAPGSAAAASTSGVSSALAQAQTGIQTALQPIGDFNTASGPSSYVMGVMRTVGNVGSFAVALMRVWMDSVLYAPLSGLLGGAELSAGPVAALTGAGSAAAGTPAVLAHAGGSSSVGQLSVPKSWTSAVPAATMGRAAELVGDIELAAASESLPMGIPTEAIAAAAGMMVGRASVSSVLKVPPKRFKMPRHSSVG